MHINLTQPLILIAIIICLLSIVECASPTVDKDGLKKASSVISSSTKATYSDTIVDYDDEDDGDYIDDEEEDVDDDDDDEDYVEGDAYDEYDLEYHKKADGSKNKNANKKGSAAKPSAQKPKNTVVSKKGSKVTTEQTTKTSPAKTPSAAKTTPKKTKTKAQKAKQKENEVTVDTEEVVPATDLSEVKFITNVDDGSCSLKLNIDIAKKNEPLFLTKDSATESYSLAFPTLVAKGAKYDKGIAAVKFKKEDSIYLSCPGDGNGLSDLNEIEQSHSKIKCSGGTQVYATPDKEPKLMNSKDLVCLKPAEPTAIYSMDQYPCGDIKKTSDTPNRKTGKLIEIGFLSDGFHKLIDVCYDAEHIQTLYASHTLYGDVLSGAVVDSNRPTFKKGQDDFYNGNPIEYYKMNNQKDVLYQFTGIGKYFDSAHLFFMAKGHYAPDADFLFKTWQDATYFFVNCGPQWQCINQGHWLSVERLSRNIAMKLGVNIDVSTGPYGIMQLKNRSGVMEDFYLTYPQKLNKRKPKIEVTYLPLAVPSHYWKILHTPDNKCIVFVSTNNPYTDDPDDFNCNNICEKNKWPKLWDKKKGYVRCCAFEDFKKVVTYAPNYNCKGGILEGP